MTDTATPYRFGYKPSLLDPRDSLAFESSAKVNVDTLPESFSLRDQFPPVYDQGNLGSCTGNAIAALLQFDKMLDGIDMGIPSRLFIYYCERVREGTVSRDSGAYGRDGFASLRKTGAPPEAVWPYEINRFTEKPSAQAYEEASRYKIKTYVHPRRSGREIMALILNRQPIAVGATLFESFEGSEAMRTGYIPMPNPSEKIIGGHEFDLVGWTPEYVECRNSWGPGVQDEGYFWLPWGYVLGGYCSDFRAISRKDS